MARRWKRRPGGSNWGDFGDHDQLGRLNLNRQPDPGVLARSGVVLDGSDERLLQWISDSGIAALIADNYQARASPR